MHCDCFAYLFCLIIRCQECKLNLVKFFVKVFFDRVLFVPPLALYLCTITLKFKAHWRRKKIKRLNSSNPWLQHFSCHHDRDFAITQSLLSPTIDHSSVLFILGWKIDSSLLPCWPPDSFAVLPTHEIVFFATTLKLTFFLSFKACNT